MVTITIRDFRTRPRQARAALRAGQEAVLTTNGKPVALMVPVDAETLAPTALALRRARAQLALDEIRAAAKQAGTDRLSGREIDEVIVRRRKRRRR